MKTLSYKSKLSLTDALQSTSASKSHFFCKSTSRAIGDCKGENCSPSNLEDARWTGWISSRRLPEALVTMVWGGRVTASNYCTKILWWWPEWENCKSNSPCVFWCKSTAYKAVALSSLQDASGQLTLVFLLASIKLLTPARLELMSALIASILHKYIIQKVTIGTSKSYFWSDSMTALCWTQKDMCQRKMFLKDRVHEIQRTTKRKRMRYCIIKHNSADPLIRGVSLQQLIHFEIW